MPRRCTRRARLKRVRNEALVLQFGGATGTLAALGDRGFEVAIALRKELDLPLPDGPWHTHRDRLADVASAFAILAGTCGKIARDVALLMQTEVGEAFEPAGEGRGGSSTMPHKRNPVAAAARARRAAIAPQLCATILAAQVQEHERAAGAWAAEWPTFPALALVTRARCAPWSISPRGSTSMPSACAPISTSPTDRSWPKRSRSSSPRRSASPTRTNSSKRRARTRHAEKKQLKDALAADPKVTAIFRGEISKLFDPMSYQGVAQQFIDRLFATAKAGGDRGRSDFEMPLDRRRPDARSNGCASTSAGTAAPVLMLSSSLGTTQHMWDPQMEALHAKYRVVRYDRRGHGKSGAPKGPYDGECWTRRDRGHGRPGSTR